MQSQPESGIEFVLKLKPIKPSKVAHLRIVDKTEDEPCTHKKAKLDQLFGDNIKCIKCYGGIENYVRALVKFRKGRIINISKPERESTINTTAVIICEKNHDEFQLDAQRLREGRWCKQCKDEQTITCDCKKKGLAVYAGGLSYVCEHNNFKIMFPNIAKQWCYERNVDLLPEQFTVSSMKPVWWKCEKMPCSCHYWEAPIHNRTARNQACPYCHSKPCPHNNLKVVYPQIAAEWDYEKNYPHRPEDYSFCSAKTFHWKCLKATCNCHRWSSSITNRTNIGSGCPFCSGKKICPHNNFKLLYPQIAAQWDYTKNIGNPEDYPPFSTEEVWWICKKACECHSWKTRIHGRTSKLMGCPFCKGRPCCHKNFKTCYPDAAEEWDYEKNDTVPEQYSLHNPTYVWWKCKKDHEWFASIGGRSYGSSCPECSPTAYSKVQIRWLTEIEKAENIKIQHALSGAEFKIKGIGKVDGYYKKTNTVYEFHGDFWHGNPKVFDPDKINPISKKRYGDLYQKTIDRDNEIRKLGYNLVTMWENDYYSNCSN